MTNTNNPNDMLTIAEVAELLDVKRGSVATYHTQATRRRKHGEVRPGDMPEPDRIIGRTPTWLRSTIDGWERPGPGKGGGRPWPAGPRDEAAEVAEAVDPTGVQ